MHTAAPRALKCRRGNCDSREYSRLVPRREPGAVPITRGITVARYSAKLSGQFFRAGSLPGDPVAAAESTPVPYRPREILTRLGFSIGGRTIEISFADVEKNSPPCRAA